MNIQDFKIFFDIVTHNSFSQAAAMNHVSQSAVSQTVRRLESELNCRLIDRSVRPFQLTRAGKHFFEGSKKILNLFESLCSEVQASETEEEIAGVVRVAAIYSVGLVELNQRIQLFVRLHPKTNVRLAYQRPNLIYDSLDRDEVDLGVVSYPLPRKDLKILHWRNERMALVCHPDHPLSRQNSITADLLQGVKLIAFDRDLPIRKQIDKWLLKNGIEAEIVMEFDNVENIKQAVEVKAGASILPLPTVKRDVHYRYLSVVPLESAELIRPVGILHKKHKPLSTASQAFIKFLLDSTD
ncbi:LysR family transcriptional regulator [Candidatus Sumerlaeota bacterium]|nr:LysR family transcriptional regulator [Candidatus Sumerlaeota bacterium]